MLPFPVYFLKMALTAGRSPAWTADTSSVGVTSLPLRSFSHRGWGWGRCPRIYSPHPGFLTPSQYPSCLASKLFYLTTKINKMVQLNQYLLSLSSCNDLQLLQEFTCDKSQIQFFKTSNYHNKISCKIIHQLEYIKCLLS